MLSMLSLLATNAKDARGQIRLPANLSEWLTAATAPKREAPFTHEIVLLAQQPAATDRFLTATAQIIDHTLVTEDDTLVPLGTIRTMKN